MQRDDIDTSVHLEAEWGAPAVASLAHQRKVRRQRPLVRLLGAGAALVVVGGAAVITIKVGSRGTPVTVASALEQYRAAEAAAGGGAGQAPVGGGADVAAPAPSQQAPVQQAGQRSAPSQVAPQQQALPPTTVAGAAAPVGGAASPAGQQAAAPAVHPTGPVAITGVNQGSAPSQPTGAVPAPASQNASQPAATAPASSGPQAAHVPANGVYTFATSGSEELTDVPGSSRSFPSSTPQVGTRHTCGVQLAWQPFQQHTEDYDLCADGSNLDNAGFAFDISFYGQDNKDAFTCPAGSVIASTASVPGSVTTAECTSPVSKADTTTTVVGDETLTVGGKPVKTVHVRMAEKFTGQENGTGTTEYWFDLESFLPVKTAVNIGLDVHSSLGDHHYHEAYTLLVNSLQPQT